MSEKKPVYLYRCIVCGKSVYTENTILKHCNKLTEWILGIEGKGVNMESRKVKLFISGHVIMTEENLNNLLAYGDSTQAILYALHMPYVDTENLVLEVEE